MKRQFITTIKQINKEIEKLQKVKNRAQESLEAIYLQDCQKFVGNCYKYPNSDGQNEFPTYFQVQKILDVYYIIGKDNINVTVEGLEFDEQPNNIKVSRTYFTYLSTWEDFPISKEEFMEAYSRVLRLLEPI